MNGLAESRGARLAKLMLILAIIFLGCWGFSISVWAGEPGNALSFAWTALLILPALATIIVLLFRGPRAFSMVAVAAMLTIQLLAPIMSALIFRNI